MRTLYDSDTWVVAEEGAVVLFFQRDIWPSWVPAFAATATLMFGVLGTGSVGQGSLTFAGTALLLVLATITGVVAVKTLRSRHASLTQPLARRNALLELDFQERTVCEPGGRVLCKLGDVRLVRVRHILANSRSLVARWPGDWRELFRVSGTDSLDEVMELIVARGLSVEKETWL